MSDVLTLGSLFSGIGGLEYGLEMTGRFKTVWQVEKDAYCRKVLAKHWPEVTRYEDVKDVGKESLAPVDVICGGFPCQDISGAGRRAGIVEGNRSGLWHEYVRIIRELRPRYVIVENVSALLVRGLDVVLGELAESGYDAEWSMLSAADVGAHHLRQRIFVVAHAERIGPYQESNNPCCRQSDIARSGRRVESARCGPTLADTVSIGLRGGRHSGATGSSRANAGKTRQRQWLWADTQSSREDMADPRIEQRDRWLRRLGGWGREPLETLQDARRDGWQEDGLPIPESLLGRVADGLPSRVDRLKSLGNAVVPQCARVIGEWLLEIHDESVSGLSP